MRRAIISLGTNSTRLLIVEVASDGRLIERYHEAVLTRLGEGLGDRGSLAPAAIARTLAVVERYARRVRDDGAASVAIATSAVRRAEDGETFRARFRTIAGVELEVIGGEEEARYSFLGATYGRLSTERVAVLDIGGGSTELAVGKAEVEAAISIEIGAVRLTELFPGLAGHDGPSAAASAARLAERYVRPLLAAYERLPAPESVMAVAGTPMTIAAMADVSALADGRTLTASQAQGVLDLLLRTPYEARRQLEGMTPDRADILAAGAIIYIAALRALKRPDARVTQNDLLLGYLSLELLARAAMRMRYQRDS